MARERGGAAPIFAAAREEAAALSARLGREEGEGGRTRPGGLARPAWPLEAKKVGWASWPLGRLG
jgi:hypothetical protein